MTDLNLKWAIWAKVQVDIYMWGVVVPPCP